MNDLQIIHPKSGKSLTVRSYLIRREGLSSSSERVYTVLATGYNEAANLVGGDENAEAVLLEVTEQNVPYSWRKLEDECRSTVESELDEILTADDPEEYVRELAQLEVPHYTQELMELVADDHDQALESLEVFGYDGPMNLPEIVGRSAWVFAERVMLEHYQELRQDLLDDEEKYEKKVLGIHLVHYPDMTTEVRQRVLSELYRDEVEPWDETEVINATEAVLEEIEDEREGEEG